MDKIALINKIKNLESLTADERSALLDLLRTPQKYGLVWKNKPEAVEEEMKLKLPVLTEVKERALINDTDTEHYPNHLLIEGDNLHALTVFSYTHSGKVDMIYIDPPYNTGNKDFIYNDKIVDKEDGYRHSKWLSFMKKRLQACRSLLSDNGVIFISIDDNEQAHLKLLCDEIFLESNFVATLPTIMNLKGNQDEFGFAGTHEYTLVYAKNHSQCYLGQLPVNDEELDDWLEDNIGYYKKGATLKRTGQDAPRERRPYGYFPILIKKANKSIETITDDEYRQIYNPSTDTFNDEFVEALKFKYESLGYTFLLPTAENKKTSWRWGFNTIKKDKGEIIVTDGRQGVSLYKKQRPELGDIPSKKPKSIFYKPEYSSGNGKSEITSVMGTSAFGYPKPIELIKDFITIGTKKDSVLLDFFAGSGTTMQALMQLNAEDGGHRQCILVTNNENGICENVTYERNKRVIEGYTTPKGEKVEGLRGNNLRYYKTDFVPRERTVKNMRALVDAATDMLCIKEGMYRELEGFGPIERLPRFAVRHFAGGSGEDMLIVYDETVVPELVDVLYGMQVNRPVKIYTFSPNRDPYSDEFEDVEEKVELCALPAAIYDAYREVLPPPIDRELNATTDPAEEEEQKEEENAQ